MERRGFIAREETWNTDTSFYLLDVYHQGGLPCCNHRKHGKGALVTDTVGDNTDPSFISAK